jgi:hypothetical protein
MKAVLLTIGLFGVVFSAYAHHSFGYHFDGDREVTITGTVKEFRFINPHAQVLVDVAGEDGQIETWTCEFRGANGLARTGWREDTFQPGQALEITGYGARRSATDCYFDYAVLADGARITQDDLLGGDLYADGDASIALSTAADSDIPNFAGVWGMGPGGGRPTGMGPQPGGPNRFASVLSDAGLVALDAYDPVTDDPSVHCKPPSLTRLWGTGNPTEITQDDELLTIHHEWLDVVRDVHLGLSEHPEGTTDRVMGHSIGWYEDSTLVIDTVAYEPSVLFQFPGLPTSNQLHTVEHLTLSEDGQQFEISWTAEDSAYFTEPVSGMSRPLQRLNTTLRPYNCEPMDVG